MTTSIPTPPTVGGGPDVPTRLRAETAGDRLVVTSDALKVLLELDRPVVEFRSGVRLSFLPACAGAETHETEARVAIDGPTLVRVVHEGMLGADLRLRVTFDVFQRRNVHVHVRLQAVREVELDRLALPRIAVEGGDLRAEFERTGPRSWLDLVGPELVLGLIVKKQPWKASWNDVGAHDHRLVGSSTLEVTADSRPVVDLSCSAPIRLGIGDTVESAVILRVNVDGVRSAAEEARYTLEEAKYVPEGEYRHGLVWETEDVWLGPPITEGSPQRPHDQLIPRPLGLDVLARKRFTWNNEDFSLWRITGKDRYWDSGIKKAHALVATQNEHGGWFEGIEFYNLAPRHHQMYDTYIGGLFLLEAYDATGDEAFLAAARRCCDFWLAAPPANGHTVVGGEGWWYRWGGYVNEFGYTDQRHVLNTHAGATEFLAQLYERTGDEAAGEAMRRGIAAFKWGLRHGIQRGDGQFLYCLSQVDPRLELPGDPPYLERNLIPQIEDVYTVASSYRLLMANRIARDEDVAAAVARALDYWWTGYRQGAVVTYRAYAVIAYALAAGELDVRYALALPELLKDREHYTSMQRGLSTFIHPRGLPGLGVDIDQAGGAMVEPIFIRRTTEEFVFALVNMEAGLTQLGLHVELPPDVQTITATALDPASGDRTPLAAEVSDARARLVFPDLPEFGVALVELEL